MNLSQQSGLAAFQAVAAQFNGGTLNVYQGAMPNGPEAALASGTTLLVPFTFAATAFPTTVFDTSGYQKGNAAFTANPVTPTAAGTAIFARALESNGTPIADLTLAQAWTQSLPVKQSQYIVANGNLYMCTAAGTTSGSPPGPTGNGANVQDGTAYWMYLRPGAADVMLQSAVLSTSVALNWPYLWLAMPCV